MTAPPWPAQALQPAADRAWFEQHIAARIGSPDPDLESVPVTIDGFIASADDAIAAERLRSGAIPRVAAMFIVGWFGSVFGGAAVRAAIDGYVLDLRRIHTLRYHDGVYVGVGVADGSEPFRARLDPDAAIDVAVTELVDVLSPAVDRFAVSCRAGRAGLWGQVADGIGQEVALTLRPGDDVRVARLRAALHHPSSPWRRPPDISVGTEAVTSRRATCCLSYLLDPADPDRERCDDCPLPARR